MIQTKLLTTHKLLIILISILISLCFHYVAFAGSGDGGSNSDGRGSMAFDTRTGTFAPASSLTNVSYDMVGPLSGQSVPSNNDWGGDGGGNGGGGSGGIVPKQIIPPSFTASSSGGDIGDSVSGTNISINIGDTVTLSWTCYDSFSSGGLNFSTGDATSGSVEVTPEMTTEYELLCSNAGKSTVTITVLVPELSITADPDLVRINHVTDIIWSSTNVKSCSVSEDNPDYVDYWSTTSGREATSKITSETNYTLLCDNGFRFFMDSVKVRLIPIFEEF